MNTRAPWELLAAVVLAAGVGMVVPPNAYLGLVAVLLLATAGAIGLVLQMDRPALAMLVLVGTAVAFPLEFRGPAGVMMGSSLPLAALLCGIWLLRSLLARDASGMDRSRVVVSAGVFLGVTLLAFAIGQFPWFPSPGAPLPAQIVELGLFSLSILLFLSVGHQVKGLQQLRWLTWTFIAAGTITVVIQTVPGLTLSVGRFTTRPGSVGSLFWTWFVAVTVAQAVANHHLRLPVRVLLLGLAAIALGHGLIQVRSWASGWLPSLIAVGVILILRWPRAILGLGLLAVPVGLYLSGDIGTALLGDEGYSLSTRQEAWRVLWQIVERNPLLGTGLANYYYFAENFPILGWYVPFISHNNYQDLLVQTGVLGLVSFCWFAFEVSLMSLRLFQLAPTGFASAYALAIAGGTAGSLAAGMLGDWVIPFYYNAGVLGFRSSLLFWVFLGGGLALRRMLTAPRMVPAFSRSIERHPVAHGVAIPSPLV